MGLFWKRKSGDQFVSLKLNEPLPEKATDREGATEPPANLRGEQCSAVSSSVGAALEPVPTGAGPTPVPGETSAPKIPAIAPQPQASAGPLEAVETELSPQKPVPSRSPFATSIL